MKKPRHMSRRYERHAEESPEGSAPPSENRCECEDEFGRRCVALREVDRRACLRFALYVGLVVRRAKLSRNAGTKRSTTSSRTSSGGTLAK